MLRTAMSNKYPQVAVLGCDSRKANLYYDVQRQVWIEDLISVCANNEETILKFCQKIYPSLQIGNVARLNTILRFDNWCELTRSNDNSNPECQIGQLSEESVQPYRCLHANSALEDFLTPGIGCSRRSMYNPSECLHAEKWEQKATIACSEQQMILNSPLKTLDWCGLGEFRGVEFICCPSKHRDTNQIEHPGNKNNYASEDDPIQELLLIPEVSTSPGHNRLLAMSRPFTAEPDWIRDYHQWSSDSSSFADDEDNSDDQEEIKLSSARKSHLTITEHERFTKEKQKFKQNYQSKIEQLKLRWQKRQSELQSLAAKNPRLAQSQYEKADLAFRQEYESIKQAANQERTRINELHEQKLDQALDTAKKETNEKLITAWNDKPLKSESIQEAMYNYLHVLLRDRIHLVNRYERLKVVDPAQAKQKRASIHERLRTIAEQIQQTLNKLALNQKLQMKIQSSLNSLISEYEEVNEAAERLLIAYNASLTSTTEKNRRLLLGKDERKINPLFNVTTKKSNSTDYDDDEEMPDSYDDETNDSNDDNDNENDSDQEAVSPIKDSKDETRSYRPRFIDIRPVTTVPKTMNQITSTRHFPEYIVYMVGCILVLCIIIAMFYSRRIRERRQRGFCCGQNEKNYTFTGIDSSTPEEKALRALQINGYENPTYKFFESQPMKC